MFMFLLFLLILFCEINGLKLTKHLSSSFSLKSLSKTSSFNKEIISSSFSKEFNAIKDLEIINTASGNSVPINSLWSSNDRAIVICMRSFACIFCQELGRTIAKEIIPRLRPIRPNTAVGFSKSQLQLQQIIQQNSTKLIIIGIGSLEQAQTFCKFIGFPSEYLYVDTDNSVYKALELAKASNQLQLVTDLRTMVAVSRRFAQSRADNFIESVKNYEPIFTPSVEQGLQQGGTFVFEGYTSTIYARKDLAMGDHSDMNLILRIALASKFSVFLKKYNNV